MRTIASELGPQVERLSDQPRIYADANVPAGVIAHMRNRLGWDVFAVIEHDDLRRASDVEHYRLARQLQRTLVSLDRDYFDEPRFPTPDSGGVIVLSAPNERGLTKLLSKIDRAYFRRPGRRGARAPVVAPPLVGQKLEVHPDWQTTEPASAAKSQRRPRRSRKRGR